MGEASVLIDREPRTTDWTFQSDATDLHHLPHEIRLPEESLKGLDLAPLWFWSCLHHLFCFFLAHPCPSVVGQVDGEVLAPSYECPLVALEKEDSPLGHR